MSFKSNIGDFKTALCGFVQELTIMVMVLFSKHLLQNKIIIVLNNKLEK